MKTKAKWIISDPSREALANCELFQDLSREQLMEVAALVEEFSIEPEVHLLREGEAASYFFVVVVGRGVAQLEMERGWLSLGLVGPGSAVGWSSLVEGRNYPASVKALTEMQVARIDAKGLLLLMNLEPSIGYPVSRRLSILFCRQYQSALEAFKLSG